MRVRWTRTALDDLVSIARYIRQDDPAAAKRVRDRVASDVAHLAVTPYQGRRGAVPGTRELVFAPWPYIAVYEIEPAAAEVRILRIRHAAQLWPSLAP